MNPAVEEWIGKASEIGWRRRNQVQATRERHTFTRLPLTLLLEGKAKVKVKVEKWVGFADRMHSPCFPWPLQDRISRMALGWRVIVAWNRRAEKMDLFLLTYQE